LNSSAAKQKVLRLTLKIESQTAAAEIEIHSIVTEVVISWILTPFYRSLNKKKNANLSSARKLRKLIWQSITNKYKARKSFYHLFKPRHINILSHGP